MATVILSIIVTPITEIAKGLISQLKNQAGYLVKYKNNVKHLRNETEEFRSKIDSASSAIDDAHRRGEAVNKDMEHWFQEAKRTMYDVQKYLVSDSGQEEKGVSEMCCTSLRRRYVLSKRAVKLFRSMNKLKDKLQLIPVSRPAPPPSIELLPTGDFEAFESARMAMQIIVATLSDDDCKVIGVYGMGGVGKTSLIREVAKLSKIMNMFDEVVIATVSRNPDMKKMQREIAEGLGMRLEEETEHIRSLRLAERLKQESRILIILDDVWEIQELSNIGIPSRQEKSKCKIVITTRNLDVCSEMYCDVSIQVNPLSQQEAWRLFKKVAGDIVESPDLIDVATEVAGECGGLPIALVTVGRVLRNKELRMWQDAAYELRQSTPVNIKGMHEKVFACLKLSFDQFLNEESKLCYLYCSLFSEDYDVRIEDLLRYGIGEGLFSGVETVNEARSRVHFIISNLKASCLLLSNDNEESVKMHDVYRDLAISIATSDDYSFMVKASSGLKEWPRKPKLEYVMRMSLIDNEFSMLCGQKEYPELLLLLLQNNTTLQSISDDFFAGMTALKVLDLSNIPNLLTLPPSISCLTSLRTLCVENNNLKDGSALGGLFSLEILSLRKTSFVNFPEEIRNLTNLRVLDLTDSHVGAIPAGVISSLKNLEELYMGGSYDGWEVKESESEGRATLTEILSLEHLNTLHIDIGKHKCLTEEITDFEPRLKKFHLLMGDRFDWQTTHDRSMCFNIQCQFGVPRPFMNWVKRLLETTLQLSLLRWEDLSSLEQLQSDEFHALKHLHIQECGLHACFSDTLFERFRSLQELRILSCFKLDTVFLFGNNDHQKSMLPRLTKMHIKDAPRLTALWKGVAPSACFQSLKHLKVEFCVQIKNLFSFAIARRLNQLQHLKISNCEGMEVLVSNGAHEISEDIMSGQSNVCDDGVELRTVKSQTLFPKLRTLKLMHLKNLRSLTQPQGLLGLPALQHIMVLSSPCLKKLPLGSEGLQSLSEIRAERKWFEELLFEDNEAKLFLQSRFIDISTSHMSQEQVFGELFSSRIF